MNHVGLSNVNSLEFILQVLRQYTELLHANTFSVTVCTGR